MYWKLLQVLFGCVDHMASSRWFECFRCIDSTCYTWWCECFRDIDLACVAWEQILLDHPTDAFVARLLHNGYYHLGANEALRDSVARVLPEWPKSRPLYGYLLGIHAFGLCETRDFEKAASLAHKACCSLQFSLIDI